MMPGCAIRKGFCNVEKFTYIWDAETVPVCFPAPFYNQTVSIHTDKQGKVLNIRIPKLGLAYNHLTQCPQYVLNCRDKKRQEIENFHCSAEGVVFYTAQCQELKRRKSTGDGSKDSEISKGEKLENTNRSPVEDLFALDTYNFLADEIEDLQEKTDILRYLTACKQSHMADQVLKKISRLFPSEIIYLFF